MILIAAMTMVAGTDSVAAAELDDVIGDVVVTPTSLEPGDRIRTDVEFCVPDSATAGDTFSLTLAEQLTQLPGSITLRDPDGTVVATATISGQPAVATFELTGYVDERVDVCGTAFFESELSGSAEANSEQTLSFILSGVVTFETVVTVGEPEVGTNRDTARKSAVFNDVADQCRTSLDSCLSWFIESRPGPFASVVITDDGLVDASFECSTLTVRLWSLQPGGSRDVAVLPGDVGATITQSCTVDAVEVTVTNVPAGVIVRSLLRATPSFAAADGGLRFRNVASVTHVTADETSTTDEVNGRVRSSAAGGEASGVIPSTTTATSTTTTTTTVATVATIPTVGATTTTTVATVATIPTVGATTTTVARESGAVVPTTTVAGSGAAATTTTTTVAGSGAAATTTTTTVAGSGAAATTTTVAPILPATGSSNHSMVVVALFSALVGAAMIAASRRRLVS
jgi:LPXTG-motif cell wall-anchored protein